MVAWTAVGPSSEFYTSWVADMGPYIGPDTVSVDYLPTDAAEIDFRVGLLSGDLQTGTFTGPSTYAYRYRFNGTERNGDDTLSGEGVDPATAHLYVVWSDPAYPDDPANLVPPSVPPTQVVPPIYATGGLGPYRGPGRWSDYQSGYEVSVNVGPADSVAMYAVASYGGSSLADAKAKLLQAQQMIRAGEFNSTDASTPEAGVLETATMSGRYASGGDLRYAAALNYDNSFSSNVSAVAIRLETPVDFQYIPNGQENVVPPVGVEGIDYARNPDTDHYREFDGFPAFIAWAPWTFRDYPGWRHSTDYGTAEVGDSSYVSIRAAAPEVYAAMFDVCDLGAHPDDVALRNAAWPTADVGAELVRYATVTPGTQRSTTVPLDTLGRTGNVTLLFQLQPNIEDVTFISAVDPTPAPLSGQSGPTEAMLFAEFGQTDLRPGRYNNYPQVRVELPRWRYWIPGALVYPAAVAAGYWGVRL